jgi:hypothetical protein
MAILVPWIIRGIILSGYPAYPEAAMAFPVEWQIPRALVLGEANWIRSWARQPWVFWSDVLSSSEWLQPWLNTLPSQVTKPLELTLLALVIIGSGYSGRTMIHQKRKYGQWLFLFPPVVSLVFWFVSAPDPRFSGALFWIVAAGALALALDEISHFYNFNDHARIFGGYLLCVIVFLYISPIRNPLWIIVSEQYADGLHPIPTVEYETLTTESGLMIHVPVGKDQYHCWNAPLPCAPDLRSTLRLRRPGDLSKGFILEKKREIANTVDIFHVPDGFTSSSDLGIALAAGWHDFDLETKVRWMESPGRILLYTEQATTVRLSLTPQMMHTDNTFGNTGQLVITVNDNTDITIPVATNVTSEILLRLHRDFNIVQLGLLEGNFVPAETISGYNDTRSLSIAFSEIELVTVK